MQKESLTALVRHHLEIGVDGLEWPQRPHHLGWARARAAARP